MTLRSGCDGLFIFSESCMKKEKKGTADVAWLAGIPRYLNDTLRAQNDANITFFVRVHLKLETLSPVTETFNVLFARNSHLTGRQCLLNELQELLRSEEGEIDYIALHGCSAIGKSQIAIEYAYRNADFYNFIYWINAKMRRLFLPDFVSLWYR